VKKEVVRLADDEAKIMITPEELDLSFLNNKNIESKIRHIVQKYWESIDISLAWKYLASQILTPGKNGATKKFILHGAGRYTCRLIEAAEGSPQINGLVAILDKNPVQHNFSVPVVPTERVFDFDFDFIVLSSKPSEFSMKSDLLRLGVDEQKIITIYKDYKEDVERNYERKVEDFIGKLDKGFSKERIVFVVLYPHNLPLVEQIVRGLKKDRIYELVGVYLLEKPPEGMFDYTFFCNQSLAYLVYILSQIEANLIYVAAHGEWAYLSILIKAVRKDILVIQEVYDWMESFIPDDRMAIEEGYASPEVLDVIRFSENFVRHEIEGFIYKDGGQTMKEILQDSSIPSLQFLPYPPKCQMHFIDKEPFNKPMFVYAGAISPTSESSIYKDTQLLPLFRDITRQGCSVTAYNVPLYDEYSLKMIFSDYYHEAEHNSLFSLKKGIPLPSLIPILAQNYEYGLMLYYFDADIFAGRKHLTSSMASKIFTYIAGGLPIIISEELENMANFVREHGIGIVVSRKEISNISNVISGYSYGELRNNIRIAQEKLCMENNIHNLKGFLRDVITDFVSKHTF
jgi:hypothetical protein